MTIVKKRKDGQAAAGQTAGNSFERYGARKVSANSRSSGGRYGRMCSVCPFRLCARSPPHSLPEWWGADAVRETARTFCRIDTVGQGSRKIETADCWRFKAEWLYLPARWNGCPNNGNPVYNIRVQAMRTSPIILLVLCLFMTGCELSLPTDEEMTWHFTQHEAAFNERMCYRYSTYLWYASQLAKEIGYFKR